MIVVWVLLWFAYIGLVSLPLMLIGIPICFFLAKSEAWDVRRSQYYDRDVTAWTPRWAWVWSNEEDGVLGAEWWRSQNPGKSLRWYAFMWSALRNPTHNLQFVPWLGPIIDPKRIEFKCNSVDPSRDSAIGRLRVEWSFTWQGLYSGFVWRWQVTKTHHIQVRIGWKLLPRDRTGVASWDYRRVRCPFGLQLHVWRKS